MFTTAGRWLFVFGALFVAFLGWIGVRLDGKSTAGLWQTAVMLWLVCAAVVLLGLALVLR